MSLPMTSVGWLVVRTKGHRELYAAENIARLGFTCYLPKLLETVSIKGRGFKQRLSVPRPVFPGYLFVQSPHGQWRVLLSSWGVVGIVLFGDKPAFIRQHIVDQIRDNEHDGLIELPRPPVFQTNQRVKINKGVLSGQQGIFLGMGPQDRIRVLLDCLGRKTSVLFERSVLEAA